MISLVEGCRWAGTYYHSIWEDFFHICATPKTRELGTEALLCWLALDLHSD